MSFLFSGELLRASTVFGVYLIVKKIIITKNARMYEEHEVAEICPDIKYDD